MVELDFTFLGNKHLVTRRAAAKAAQAAFDLRDVFYGSLAREAIDQLVGKPRKWTMVVVTERIAFMHEADVILMATGALMIVKKRASSIPKSIRAKVSRVVLVVTAYLRAGV